MGGAPVWEPIKWNLATIFYSLQGLLILLVGIAMLFGDDAVIPEQMKPLNSSQVKFVGTTELTLSAYLFGSILTGHAQAMQPFCALFMLVARAARRHRRLGGLPFDRRVGDGAPLLGALLEGKGRSEEAVAGPRTPVSRVRTKTRCREQLSRNAGTGRTVSVHLMVKVYPMKK